MIAGTVAVSHCKHDPCALDRLGLAVAIRNDRFEPFAGLT